MNIIYCCQDCGNRIGETTALRGQGRCRFCASLGERNSMFGRINKTNPNYKDGRTLRKYYCKCDKEVGWRNALYHSGLCHKCSIKGNRNPNFKHGTFKCKICKKDHTYRKTKTGICRNCSLGKIHWSYIHGQYKAPYPIIFNKRLKNKIKTRDKFKCQNCRIDNKLCIHHIDYNKQNCKENNLITVCNKCNLNANYNRDYWYAFYTYKMGNK